MAIVEGVDIGHGTEAESSEQGARRNVREAEGISRQFYSGEQRSSLESPRPSEASKTRDRGELAEETDVSIGTFGRSVAGSILTAATQAEASQEVSGCLGQDLSRLPSKASTPDRTIELANDWRKKGETLQARPGPPVHMSSFASQDQNFYTPPLETSDIDSGPGLGVNRFPSDSSNQTFGDVFGSSKASIRGDLGGPGSTTDAPSRRTTGESYENTDPSRRSRSRSRGSSRNRSTSPARGRIGNGRTETIQMISTASGVQLSTDMPSSDDPDGHDRALDGSPIAGTQSPDLQERLQDPNSRSRAQSVPHGRTAATRPKSGSQSPVKTADQNQRSLAFAAGTFGYGTGRSVSVSGRNPKVAGSNRGSIVEDSVSADGEVSRRVSPYWIPKRWSAGAILGHGSTGPGVEVGAGVGAGHSRSRHTGSFSASPGMKTGAFASSSKHTSGINEADAAGILVSRGESVSTLMVSQFRARERYHLGQLYALRPRFPRKPFKELDDMRYRNMLARVHHTFLLLLSYGYVPATIFLDYNAIYVLVQLALHPDADQTGVRASWWVATGVYSASHLVWLIGIVAIQEALWSFARRWTVDRPYILPIYLSSAAFTMSAIKSFSIYSLLYRVRFGAEPRDFWIESCWLYSQNWPTVLTLIPRGVVCAIVLAIYSPASQSNPATSQRDETYFKPTSGDLTNFAYIILIVNASWVAWKTLLLLFAGTGLATSLGWRSIFERELHGYREDEPGDKARHGDSRRHLFKPSETDADLYQQASGSVGVSNLPEKLPKWAWKRRAEDRIRTLLFDYMPATSNEDLASARFSSGDLINALGRDESRAGYLDENSMGFPSIPIELKHASFSSHGQGSVPGFKRSEAPTTPPKQHRSPIVPESETFEILSTPKSSAKWESDPLSPSRVVEKTGLTEHRYRHVSTSSTDVSMVAPQFVATAESVHDAFGSTSATHTTRRGDDHSYRDDMPGSDAIFRGITQAELQRFDEGQVASKPGKRRPRSSPSMDPASPRSVDQVTPKAGQSQTFTAKGDEERASAFYQFPTFGSSDSHGTAEARKEGVNLVTFPRTSSSLTSQKTPMQVSNSNDSRISNPGRKQRSSSKSEGTSEENGDAEKERKARLSWLGGLANLSESRRSSGSESKRASKEGGDAWWASFLSGDRSGSLKLPGTRSKDARPSSSGSYSEVPLASTPTKRGNGGSPGRESPSGAEKGTENPTVPLISTAAKQVSDQSSGSAFPAPITSDKVSPTSGELAFNKPRRSMSPSGSARSTATSETDDSEERRLWASFPDQSRRHPPGLIALELQQQALATQGARMSASGRILALNDSNTSVEGLLGMGSSRIASTLPPGPAAGGRNAPLTSEPDQLSIPGGLVPVISQAGASTELSVSPSEGGLQAIREESWSSSLDSPTATKASRANSGAESGSRGSVVGSPVMRRSSLADFKQEMMPEEDDEDDDDDDNGDGDVAERRRMEKGKGKAKETRAPTAFPVIGENSAI
ncbi:hypothetical protein IE53DRAFT_363237 [Violaceomyces palustris]|uniref:Uncharacterized protein n=1 Tax=Violaceomyces palustris TaxID=1673888 RepID=A0ACD0NU94_9BASI|nr:hypothetical protein IE53DRAFT_363237 [Violaceomyces palustris]